MKNVAILISGGGSNMVALAESMTGDHTGRPVLVLSNEQDVAGLSKAEALGIATSVVDHHGFPDRAAFENAVTAELRKAGAEIICLAGFMRILTPGFVRAWTGRALNIHPSLLPKYPGLDTHARAIHAGDSEAGCTVHMVTEKLDDGPVLGQARVPIMPGDTPDVLAARVLTFEHQLYPAVLHRFLGGNRTPLYLP